MEFIETLAEGDGGSFGLAASVIFNFRDGRVQISGSDGSSGSSSQSGGASGDQTE